MPVSPPVSGTVTQVPKRIRVLDEAGALVLAQIANDHRIYPVNHQDGRKVPAKETVSAGDAFLGKHGKQPDGSVLCTLAIGGPIMRIEDAVMHQKRLRETVP
jgi:hypothetical protein